MTLKHNFFS